MPIQASNFGCAYFCVVRDENNFFPHILLRTANPIGTGYVETKQRIKVNIRLVHNIECIGFWNQDIQFVAVMQPAVCDMDVGRDAPPEVEKSVHFSRAPAVFP